MAFAWFCNIEERVMQVSEVMSTSVQLASPDDTLQAVSQSMADINVGALPVGDDGRLVGMITDRDIVVRAISRGLDPARARVRDVMTDEVIFCYEDDELEDVSAKLADLQVRRLPVLDANKRLVGIVSLGDISQGTALQDSGSALRDISQH
jgi:CBS domain-containing protein